MYEPRYIITHTILKNIGSIEASRELVGNAQLLPAWKNDFQQKAKIKTIQHGVHLEGNDLPFEQLKQMVEVDESHAEPVATTLGIVGRDRDIQEVLNYTRMVEWVDSLGEPGRKRLELDDKVIKDLHSLMAYRLYAVEERGAFRTVQVVVRDAQSGEIRYEPPPSVEVPYLIEGLFSWLYSESGKAHHPVLRAGISMYELTRIHPFTGANGPVARMVALLNLCAEGYEVGRFYAFEEYFDRNAAEYYQALQSGVDEDDYDLTYWLEFFTHGFAVLLAAVKERVLQQQKDSPFKSVVGPQVALSERQITILEIMQKQGGRAVSADFEEVITDVSIDTILRDLKDLIKKGMVKKRGKTKGAYYELVS